MIESINLTAVLVSAILAVAIGSIWYSPLFFGKMWLQALGLDREEEEPKAILIFNTIKAVFAQCIFLIAVAQFIVIGTTFSIPLGKIAQLLTLLLLGQMLFFMQWERRSLVYFLINGGYMAIVLFGGVAIIAKWPW